MSRKRIIKPPSQAVVLSLMALILIVGAPALVSMIDTEYSAYVEYPVELTFSDEDFSVETYWPNPKPPEGSDLEFSYMFEGNDLTFALNDPEMSEHFGFVNIEGLESKMLRNVSSIEIITDENLSFASNSGQLLFFINGNAYRLFNFEQILNNDEERIGYRYDFSSHDRVLLNNPEIERVVLKLHNVSNADNDGIYQYTINFNENGMIPYGEIIIGFTGAVLILCAVFATSWVGFDKLTKKSKKRRR